MSRAIDRLPDPGKRREKKVLVTAKSRSGTFSIYQALNMLGYRPYHFIETVTVGITHMDVLDEALKAKYLGIGKPYGKAEFDKWLGNYDAIVEITPLFLEELVAFYPEAKVMHVERDTEKWYTSMANTAGPMMDACTAFPLRQVRLVDPWMDSFCKVHASFAKAFRWDKSPAACKQAYDETNQQVRRVVPPEKLAIFRLEDGFGWEQMCPYLGQPIPETPYPKGNAPHQFKELARSALTPKIRMGLLKLASIVFVPMVAVGVWFYGNQ